MSLIGNFQLNENLKVEFLLPDPDSNFFVLGISELGGTDVLGSLNPFILGVSLLGGTNVLGSDIGLTWQEVNCSVSKAEISVGGEIQDSVYFQPAPASANITLQSEGLDPTANPFVRAGTKIRVRLQAPDLDRIIFQGYMDTINVTYYPQGLNLIEIVAFDIYKTLVNSTFDSFVTDPLADNFDLFNIIKIANQSGLGVSPLSQPFKPKQVPPVDETNVIVGSLLNEALQISLAVIWIDQDTEQLAYMPRVPQELEPPVPSYKISNNHPEPPFMDLSHLCLGEINVFSDRDAFFNSVKVTLASDDTQVYVQKDQDNIDFYGESAIDLTLNVFDYNELRNWTDEVFFNRTANLVNQVMTPALDREGTLTAASVFTPGTRIEIEYTNSQFNITGVYTIIKVSHRIDVDNWFTTLELWKEA
jgi:hypothetical protein